MPRLSAFNILNNLSEPLKPGEVLEWYHSVQSFSRIFGSLASDQPLEYWYYYSNDETSADGHWVTDDTIHTLNWDITAKEGTYKPGDKSTGIFLIITGRWLKFRLKHNGTEPVTFLRAYTRGMVF